MHEFQNVYSEQVRKISAIEYHEDKESILRNFWFPAAVDILDSDSRKSLPDSLHVSIHVHHLSMCARLIRLCPSLLNINIFLKIK